MISSDPLEPGSVIMRRAWMNRGRWGFTGLRLPVPQVLGKLRIAGGIDGAMERFRSAGFRLPTVEQRCGWTLGEDFDTTDFHVEAIDLLQNRVGCECGVALVVRLCFRQRSASPPNSALVILGDMSIQGNIKGVRDTSGALSASNGKRREKRALIPIRESPSV